ADSAADIKSTPTRGARLEDGRGCNDRTGPRLIAHADAGDVRRGRRSGCKTVGRDGLKGADHRRVFVVEIQLQIFAAHGPVRGKGVFRPRSSRNSPMVAAAAALGDGDACEQADLFKRRVDVPKGRTSGDVDQGTVIGQAEARAQRAELIEL